MSKTPQVTLFFHEGLKPDVALLFCNDRAQIPVQVAVKSAGTVVEEVGLFHASAHKTSVDPADLPEGELSDQLSVEPAAGADARQYEAHPKNKPQLLALEGFDDTRTLLVRTHNRAGLSGGQAKLYLGAYAKLSGYVARPGAPSETIVVYSHMNARDSAEAPLTSASRVALSLQYKPPLRVMLLGRALSTWGARGEPFANGRIYLIKPNYGEFAQVYTPKLRAMETEFSRKDKRAGKSTRTPDVLALQPASGDGEPATGTIFYCDTPGDAGDVILRAVYHGDAERGTVTQPLGDKAAAYDFERSPAAASFSWYCVKSNDITPAELSKARATAGSDGAFITIFSDAYGSQSSVHVNISTASAEAEKININYEEKILNI